MTEAEKLHKQLNPDHEVHFSIHDCAIFCVTCGYMEILPYSEEELDKAFDELRASKTGDMWNLSLS